MTRAIGMIVAVAAGLLTAGAQAGCYTVLDGSGNVLSRTSTPPVDMAWQLHQTVPYRYSEGARLIFGVGEDDCGPEIDVYYDLEEHPIIRHERAGRLVRAARRDRG